MDIETVFMSRFSIQKKPADIFELIRAAIQVGALKYPAEFDKHKSTILKMIMHHNDDLILGDDDDSVGNEDAVLATVGDEAINVEEEVEESGVETQQIHTQIKNKITATNQKPLMKIKVAIKKTVQVAPQKKQNNCNAITATTESVTELKKLSESDLIQNDEQFDIEGTRQPHNTQTKKQSHKGFKKMETDGLVQNKKLDCDTEKKREEGAQQTVNMESAATNQCTSGLTKSMPPPLMKMNVATKPVEVASPHHKKRLLSDCSPQKQSNRSAITRPMQKTTQSSAVARPMQKTTQSITDRKMKFESSKRKFEERIAEQKEAKRRIIMLDFHDIPKHANDPRAPSRCWDRKRF